MCPDRRAKVERWDFPAEFVARMRQLLGAEEASDLLAALSRPAVGLRLNPLRLSPERFQAIAPFSVAPLAYPPGGYEVLDGRPGKHPYHAAGLYYLQDPGAMAVGALTGARPGERVLDLAAAPGGKATHLAGLMGDRGVLVANDVHPVRARELAGNLERLGARHALVTCETADRLARHFGAYFDRVLLDAPCSGESMFHKSEAAREEWSPAAVEGCARRQEELLTTAARLVRPGGLLIYSTCTFSPDENEGVASAFLGACPDFRIEDLPAPPGASPGRPDWAPHPGADETLSRALRLWPHRVPGAGHFVVAFRRHEGAPSAVPTAHATVGGEARALIADFQGRALRSVGLDVERMHEAGGEVFQLPEGAPDLGSLRVVRRGWWIGTVVKGRFEPAHGLAMGLAADLVRDPVVLAADDARCAAYLRGETIAAPGDPGWVLVSVDGFPLGWGKRVGQTVKNHYPKGLRWR